MNKSYSFLWRKGFTLSATFLLLILLSVSCKKKETTIGQNNIEQDLLLSSEGVDTFTVNTSSMFEDSVATSGAPFSLLGSYNDPVFGRMNAEIYTQLLLSSTGLDFGDVNTIQVDSFVLALKYMDFYGKAGDQTFEVFEITETDGIHDDSIYYAFSILQTDGTTLIPAGKEVLEMNTNALTVVADDTVSSQLRIHLDTNLARTFINDTELNPAAFSSNEEFKRYFKGLHIRTENGTQSSGDGGIFYFDLDNSASRVILYYTQDGEQKEFDFTINQDANRFNHVDIDHTATDVEAVLLLESEGQDQYYMQAFGTRAVIKLPGLDNIPSNAVIHKAILDLPVSHQIGAMYHPGNNFTVFTRYNANSNVQSVINFASYDDKVTKSIQVDLRKHVQNIVNGTSENLDILLAPVADRISANRVILNGAQTINKKRPKLQILYTEF